MDQDDFDVIMFLVIGIAIGIIIGGGIVGFGANEIEYKLGNAICEEAYGEGSEYNHMEGNDVICKEPKDSEEFDGLRVRLE